MQRSQRSWMFVNVALVLVLVGAGASACDKNGDDRRSEPTQPAGSAQEQPGQVQPGEGQPGQAQRGAMGRGHMGRHKADVEPGQACPMAIEGVTVDVSDTQEGVALTFTTATGDVEDLRNRVQHMANMYEMHAGRGSMMWRHHGHMRGEGMQAGMGSPMPEATAKAEPVDDGARLVLTPRAPEQRDELRAQIRDHQRRMSAGECWMMEEQSERGAS